VLLVQLDQAFVPPCDHDVNGGNQKAPNGWQYCSQCREPGWVDKDVKPRTEARINPANRSTGAQRAEQAMGVAAELRREEQRSRNQHQPYRNPPDSEYDKPFPSELRARGYHHLTDSRHPSRDYQEDL
jgi:hypothetical protein